MSKSRGFSGRHHSPETKAKQAEAMRRVMASPRGDEIRAATRAKNVGNQHLLGHEHSGATRRKLSKAQQERLEQMTPEERAGLAAGIVAYSRTPEERERRRLAALGNTNRRGKVTPQPVREKLRAAQLTPNGRCEICSRECRLHRDHNHRCGCGKKSGCERCRRSRLCPDCNRGLGVFKDEPERLEAAAAYLRRYPLPLA